MGFYSTAQSLRVSILFHPPAPVLQRVNIATQTSVSILAAIASTAALIGTKFAWDHGFEKYKLLISLTWAASCGYTSYLLAKRAYENVQQQITNGKNEQ